MATDDPRALVSKVQRIVEKPKPSVAPSTLAVVGRYVLTPGIFERLATIGKGAGGEIQLTDGIADLMREEMVLAYRFEGKRFDCGSKQGYLQATVEHALADPALGPEFSDYLVRLARDLPRVRGSRKVQSQKSKKKRKQKRRKKSGR